MLRLGTRIFELVYLDEAKLRQPTRNIFSSRLSGIIFIKHDDYAGFSIAMLADKFLLRCRKGTTHQGNHLATTVLVKPHTVEEAFDNDQRLFERFPYGSVNVE
jgi:hypothetical protein